MSRESKFLTWFFKKTFVNLYVTYVVGYMWSFLCYSYKPILDIIDEHWADHLHRPLHAAAYFLNPQCHYSPDFQANADIKLGLYNCLQRMVPDPNERTTIDLQMDAFKNARRLFGLPTAITTRFIKSPGLISQLITCFSSLYQLLCSKLVINNS